jgi:HTH-type transcriptional regulator / antitoxin HigA
VVRAFLMAAGERWLADAGLPVRRTFVCLRARIARGLTQANIEETLGGAEQQIQRYESARYSTASLARLCDVLEALTVTVSEVITLKAS